MLIGLEAGAGGAGLEAGNSFKGGAVFFLSQKGIFCSYISC